MSVRAPGRASASEPGGVVVPPATIGMLGGGQLGRFAIIAARLMGYSTIVLDPDLGAPAGAVADEHLIAAYDDPAALDVMAARCSVITTEFENPPASAMERLARDVLVAPAPTAVAIAQDRLAEKAFLQRQGVAVAPFVPLVHEADLAAANAIEPPAIVKTARLGYDGKGQQPVEAAGDVATAWDALGRVPCVVERRVALDEEVSVLVARSRDARTVVYPIAENHHRNCVLDLTVLPARIDTTIAGRATDIGRHLADALDFVGVLAVELFVSNGDVLVNELAPRPHNSGHWTLDAARTDQFVQQIRAITGAALGDPSLSVGAVAMVNLLGDLWFTGNAASPTEPNWAVVLSEGDARLHLYGKAHPRPGRKMGHLTVVGEHPDDVAAKALDLRRRLAD